MLNLISAIHGNGVAASTNSYESIQTYTGSGSTVTFSSIPSTYKHLQLRALVRYTNAVTEGGVIVRFNGDSGSNYSAHYLYGQGSGTPGAGAYSSISFAYPFTNAPGGSATSDVFGVTIIDILDYANTSKYKTIKALSGYDANGSGIIGIHSSAWLNTNAINSLTIGSTAYTLNSNSQFALYGIKG